MSIKNPENIGSKIKRLRVLYGYKQEYVAGQMGLSQTGYSKIETGYSKMTLEKATLIARIYDMSLVELLEWKEANTAGQ
ncbi:hypothetical protein DYBT9275_02067 [Dyadobacter sp. CECT 9275]|uniref:HTH cro/C1-type domain-containing protein n=1 Tax=Dyadobacter helix TaxID=2822344 RepID=A0A916JA67_9BACT|nr:helix-turn-helix transcriptional regulator [Dyadobacter sp. CECT 9275]CAG4998729.1 hypothetical protein DYBT9275_02067 [Dyadobacter sp. CECT 9275]